jgi:hypothetical protein
MPIILGAKHPKIHRPIRQDRHTDVLAESHCQRTMFARIVKCDRPIEMRSPLRKVPSTDQGSAEEAMPNDKREGRSLLLGECQELRRKLMQSEAIKIT